MAVLYDDSESLWVAHKKITTDITDTVYDTTVDILGLPETMSKGETAIVEAKLTTVNPYGDVKITVFNPLGYDDVFDIGQPVIESGNSYQCNDVSKWKFNLYKSISRKSVGKMDYVLEKVLNIDMSRSVGNTDNIIKVKFPLTAMKGFTEGKYAFAVGVLVGDQDVITSTKDITILDTEYSPTLGSVTLGSPTQVSDIYSGGAAVFSLTLTVPASTSFDFSITGTVAGAEVTPIGLEIFSPGLCSGFLDHSMSLSSKTVDASFGIITNADTDSTTINFNVGFKLSDAASGSFSETLTIAGNPVSLKYLYFIFK